MNKQPIDTARTWFTREQGVVKGPFPSGMIRRFVLLGRLSEGSEISPDGSSWHELGKVGRLVPEELRRPPKGSGQEPGELARRWEDERGGERRRGLGDVVSEHRRRSDRRRPEPAEVIGHRLLRQRNMSGIEKTPPRLTNYLWLAALLVPLLATGLYLAGTLPDGIPMLHDCNAPPVAAVDWAHCSRRGASLEGAELSRAHIDDADLQGAVLRNARLSGANLSYSNLRVADLGGADLTGAVLIGADLRDADLRGARLVQANLSFADLTGARIDGAILDGAKLDDAIWLDGVACGRKSTGACRR